MAGRDEIETRQLRALQELLGNLSGSDNRFYCSRLRAAGLDGRVGSLEAFVNAMPFTTKDELVRDRETSPPFGSNLTYSLGEYTRYSQSSGTRGRPLPSIDTPESWSALLDCWDIVYDRAGVGANDVAYFAFSFGPFLGFWTAFDGAVRRGCLCIPGGGLSSVARLDSLREQGVTVLCCTPTYAMRLGEVMQDETDAVPSDFALKTIIVAGEPGGSIRESRERIRDLWGGVRVVDHHGMTEVGPVTVECEDRPLSLSVIEDAHLAEVVDRETGQEVSPGETGELVLTTLKRLACPLLRYRTGDVVRKAYAEDGSLVLDGGILGRVDDMVLVRGVNVYPTAVERVMRRFPEVAEYRVIRTEVNSMAELKIEVEPVESLEESLELAARIERALQDTFALRIPVEAVAPGVLPRFEFKSKRWIKE
ncbi:MAG: AMP-binding protein [Verrucomicrobiota bacterium]